MVPEGLDDGDNTRHKCAPGYNLEITGQRAEGQAAEILEELTDVLEEDPEHFGDGEDDLQAGGHSGGEPPAPTRPIPQKMEK